MELKDNKMDVDLKNVYSGKHDFIRDREEEGKEEGKRKLTLSTVVLRIKIISFWHKCRNM